MLYGRGDWSAALESVLFERHNAGLSEKWTMCTTLEPCPRCSRGHHPDSGSLCGNIWIWHWEVRHQENVGNRVDGLLLVLQRMLRSQLSPSVTALASSRRCWEVILSEHSAVSVQVLSMWCALCLATHFLLLPACLVTHERQLADISV